MNSAPAAAPSTTVLTALRVVPRIVLLGVAIYLAVTETGWTRGLAVLVALISVVRLLDFAGRLPWGQPQAGIPSAYLGGTHEVRLDEPGERRIHVIKVVRELTGCGLAEAKQVVDGAPILVVAGLTADGAAWAGRQLEAGGGSVTIVDVPLSAPPA